MHILKESEKGRIITLKVEFDTALLKVIITICNFSEAHFSFDSLLAKCISLNFRLIKECPYSSAWNFRLTFIRLMELVTIFCASCIIVRYTMLTLMLPDWL